MNIDDIIAEMQRPTWPAPGTPAADLTDREKMTLLRAAGVEVKLVLENGKAWLRTTRLVGIADDGNGKYIVAVGPPVKEK